jgi:hypothetical protein
LFFNDHYQKSKQTCEKSLLLLLCLSCGQGLLGRSAVATSAITAPAHYRYVPHYRIACAHAATVVRTLSSPPVPQGILPPVLITADRNDKIPALHQGQVFFFKTRFEKDTLFKKKLLLLHSFLIWPSSL